MRWLRERRPRVVAVDGPRRVARAGELSRPDERDLVRAGVCGIRYTPNEMALGENEAYYAWIVNGFRLYEELTSATAAPWTVIECFPTATWSRLGGARGGRSRARWSREVLESLGLRSLPRRMNQDARDAIGAAITARLHDNGETEAFGEIIVPVARRSESGDRVRQHSPVVSHDDARRIALALPEAVEQDHHGRPSFRVAGRIFATLWDEEHTNVMLDEDGIRTVAQAHPEVCEELWWGRRLAAVQVSLARADADLVAELYADAWEGKAPKRLLIGREGESASPSG